MSNITIYTEQDNQFYPTPQKLIDKMVEGLDVAYCNTILEPSAGKGNIVETIIAKYKSRFKFSNNINVDIDCIELDNNLRLILKDKGYNVVWDNFLTYNPFKKYDLIIMNPPFKNGEEHLLKALDLQKDGGSIICILNAETIKNSYSNQRKVLINLLNKYNADIQYIDNAFMESERKTNVEIALIKINIEKVEEENPWWEKFQKAEEYKSQTLETNEIIIDDFIQKAIQLYNIEVKSTLELIKHYNTLAKHINCNFGDDIYNKPILKLTLSKKSNNYDTVTINQYLEQVRLKYWRGLFANPKFTSKLTSNMQTQYREEIYNLKNYEFNKFNINNLMIEMNASIQQGVKTTIIELFDKLTINHSYYPECKNNIHYYNGWKTNKAHKINYKVIVPCYGVFSEKIWGGNFQPYKAIDVLQDIEKTLNYLDGNMTKSVDLHSVINQAKDNPKNIECKFFKVTFYKKGTCHITFTNQELIDKFNIYVGKNKNWLPPYYGNIKYEHMTKEEQQIVDEFQGKINYEKVIKNQNYYLNTNDLVRIE